MVRKIVRGVGLVVGGIVALAGAAAVYVQVDGIPSFEPPPLIGGDAKVTLERVERGQKLAGLLCMECHLDTKTQKATGRIMDDVPPEFGVIVSKNITQHPVKGIGSWTDAQLRTFLRTGIKHDGRFSPVMVRLSHASDDDLDAIIAYLRSGDPRLAATDVDPPGVTKPTFLLKALAHTVIAPAAAPKAPIVTPPASDPVALGRYLAVNLDCFTCHSGDITKVNSEKPEASFKYFGGGTKMIGAGGEEIFTANLTFDEETGIGRWSEQDFVRAVKAGIRPDGRALHAPMTPKAGLDDAEVAAIYAYLRSLPKIRNAFPRPAPPPDEVAAGGHTGKALYDRYGCGACHGVTGQGTIGDLTRVNDSFPTDEGLRNWLDNAPTLRPGTKMPAWKGIVREADYAPLMGYVRELGKNGAAAAKAAQNTPDPAPPPKAL